MTTSEPPLGHRPTKITRNHLERWAIVYVRQSHPQQVQRHPESAQVQANLQHLALAWGWPRQRIRVLDGDQGRSATTTVGRDDFAWLLAEIALSHVGLVLGLQFNRLAREDEACCRLIKVCAAFDTLLADLDGLYHPLDFNDRLVLTIKGLMGGIELHQLQQRMQAGRLNRARRGEWLGQVPPGYVIGPDRKLQLDPDEQVQSVIRLVLDQFAILGSLSGLLRYLRQHHIELPYRVPSGPDRGQLQWHRVHRETLRSLIRRPAYAGVYTWGRRALDSRRQVQGHRGRGRVERDPHDCAVFLPNNHPAYISWEQYQSNLQRLRQHRQRGPLPGPARQTVSLLAGLVVCGQCGCRMQTHYTRALRYACQRHALDYGMQRCQSFNGELLDRLVTNQVLAVVTPASLELSLRATAECQRERAALDQQWQQRLERARHETARAYRQYDAVEPEHRLVARTLERKWEEALLTQRALEEDHARFQQDRPHGLTAAEHAEIASLAGDLPSLWRSPQTGLAQKRRIIRLLLERVVVWAPGSSQEVTVHLHWSLGTVTEHRLHRAVRSWEQVAGAAELRQRLEAWQAAGWSSQRMAAELNAAGAPTPQGKPFTAEGVRQLLARGRPGEQQASPGRRPRRNVSGLAQEDAAASPGPEARAEPPRPGQPARVRPKRGTAARL
jgi:DNA invertase Pin-like site-specific DNA recombinase